jgi:3-dehydro-L-gulonate 2-dehydrogenase
MPDTNVLYIPFSEMQSVFTSVLRQFGFTEGRATQCAEIFTANSIDGVYTHGVNRFSKFIDYIKNKYIIVDAVPTLQNKFGGIEQWNGNYGPGPLNATLATAQAMQLAKDHGIGCVALANTNHWHRGGTYGWQAATKGFVFIGWTNTIANMPAWGATDARLGNNPIVFAIPFKGEAIVLDMAMSQYSFGAMELAKMRGEKLAVNGGYDNTGNLTNDPNAILQSMRPLPIGYWKGAGLSLLLDLLATVLSGGLSTQQITEKGIEYCSQVFIAIDISKLGNASLVAQVIEDIIADYHQSIPEYESTKITYPGERVLETRNRNQQEGIPVLKTVWDEIQSL